VFFTGEHVFPSRDFAHMQPNQGALMKRAWFLSWLLLCCVAVHAAAQAQAYLLVLNKTENTLVILDGRDYQVAARVPVGEGPHEVIASADGRFAFVGNYGTAQAAGNSLSVIDLAAKKELRRVDLGALRRPHGLVEINGKIYFTCEVNRAIARYDPAADKVDWVMGTGQDATHMIVGHAEQKKLATANIRSGTVSLFDLGTPNAALTQIATGNQPEGLDITPDGKEVWVAHRGAGDISVIDTAAKKISETLKVSGDLYRVKFTPDGKRALLTNPTGGELVVMEVASRKEVKRIPVEGVPAGITVSADGKRAFVTTIQANGIAVIDLETLRVAAKVETGKGPDGVAWAGK
jgi:YVTN family beta-propeller protein